MVNSLTVVVPSECNHSDAPQGTVDMAAKLRAEPRHKIHFKEWRLYRNKTQRDVAVAVGVGENTVSYWDNGRPPQIQHLPEIAKLFDCTIDQLFLRPPQ